MKKLLAMLLAVLMVVSVFAACGTNDDTPDNPANNDNANVDVNNPDDACQQRRSRYCKRCSSCC